MSPVAHLKAASTLLLIILNLTLWSVVLALPALLKILLPALRGPMSRCMTWIYRAAVRTDDFWLNHIGGITWDRPLPALARDGVYLVISNHQSWSDILVIQSVVCRDGPILTFLAKKQLIWVPIVGWVIWAFDFPMLIRKTAPGQSDTERRERDRNALMQACAAVKESPAALMTFVEGTRFTDVKHRAAESPYHNLLPPRPAGFATMVDALGSDLRGIVDLTLEYPRSVSFWAFLGGAAGHIGVTAEVVPCAALPTSQSALRGWLFDRWSEKDARLSAAANASPTRA